MQKLKKVKHREVTVKKGVMMVDTRKFYTFRTENGTLVETKSVSKEAALNHVKSCMAGVK